ncbi:CaiB/BaiF CoA transferase family protein [Ferviditalea candida]|uniref:CaiB/BaiF CoA-transferase family protein n=1 Tax=Ferviditalea candida TaxID=3108399 RepID=A0ABU5ZMS3_9BACL|nr:CaiB/BaiF CoA-transferase family protein [Paenibacillaceae bacterium T2]
MQLEGIRILDFSQYIPGPYAGLRLAKLGAEVIKLEPLAGDPARTEGGEKAGSGIVFEVFNRGKKSITVNLKSKEGQRIAEELAKSSNVLIESFRPGVMRRLGLHYDHLKQVKPGLIYCSISGYGQSGGMAPLGSHDLNYMALSGVLSQFRDAHGKPVHPSISIADYIGGMAASEQILAALVRFERTGKGEYLDISILGATASMLELHTRLESHTGTRHGLSLLAGDMLSYCIYETKDHRYVSLGAIEPKFWRNFCQAANRPDWIAAQTFPATSDNPVYREIVSLFRSRTLEEWGRFGLEADCCLTPILEAGEIDKPPYSAQFRQMIADDAMEPAPKLGEHTSDLLMRILNKTDREIGEYRAQGII